MEEGSEIPPGLEVAMEWAIGRVWSLGVHHNSQGVAGGSGSAQLPQSPERASSSCLGDRERGLGFLLRKRESGKKREKVAC